MPSLPCACAGRERWRLYWELQAEALLPGATQETKDLAAAAAAAAGVSAAAGGRAGGEASVYKADEEAVPVQYTCIGGLQTVCSRWLPG